MATRIQRHDGTRQALFCDLCDRLIIGVESIHLLSKDSILENRDRLSVETYEDFYGQVLNPILLSQYDVRDMSGLLLSP